MSEPSTWFVSAEALFLEKGFTEDQLDQIEARRSDQLQFRPGQFRRIS